ncbi:MAG TPA: universal stress protein [Cyclobacteriaceae bacterium]|nr:universal stress protein [Cyclobacteriaceae bacterium]
MQTILVPFDFSEEAEYAFQFAQQLATKTMGKLKLVHIVETPTTQSFSTMGEMNLDSAQLNQVYMVELVEKRKRQLQEIEEEHQNKPYGFKTRISFGNPYAGISSEITDIKADLVIMGSKGSSGLEELLIGSNTEKVVRHASCPVITVKRPTHADQIKKIIFASDFSEDNRTVIQHIKSLQELLGAELSLVKINTPSFFETTKDSRAKIESFITTHGLSNTQAVIYNSTSEEEGIIEYAQEINADMIAMATHGRTGFMHLLSGSIAEDVVNHAKRPVWTMKITK